MLRGGLPTVFYFYISPCNVHIYILFVLVLEAYVSKYTYILLDVYIYASVYDVIFFIVLCARREDDASPVYGIFGCP